MRGHTVSLHRHFLLTNLSLKKLSLMKRMSTLQFTTKLAISVRCLETPTECTLKLATNRGSEILLGEHEDLSGMEIRLFLSILVLILIFDGRKGDNWDWTDFLLSVLSFSQTLNEFLISASIFCCMNV